MTAAEARAWIAAAVFTALGVVLCYFFVDVPVARWSRLLTPGETAFFQKATILGEATWSLIVSGALFAYFAWIRKNRRLALLALFVFAAVAVSGLATDAVKWTLARWRPIALFTDGQYGFSFFKIVYEQNSFPSGHATTAAALAAALAALWPRAAWLWWLLALPVIASRVVLGAHYPGDVLAGAFVGIFTVFLLRKEPRIRDSLAGGQSVETGNDQDH